MPMDEHPHNNMPLDVYAKLVTDECVRLREENAKLQKRCDTLTRRIQKLIK